MFTNPRDNPRHDQSLDGQDSSSKARNDHGSPKTSSRSGPKPKNTAGPLAPPNARTRRAAKLGAAAPKPPRTNSRARASDSPVPSGIPESTAQPSAQSADQGSSETQVRTPDRSGATWSGRDERIKRPISNQTGPTTESGKEVVSQNALKHGFYSRPQVGDKEFAAIDLAVFNKLEPTGTVQSQIASSIADVLWRTARLEETVRTLYQGIDKERVSLTQLAEEIGFPFSKGYSHLLLVYHDEAHLLKRVRGHFEGVFAELLDKPFKSSDRKLSSPAYKAEGPMAGRANERIGQLLALGRKVLAKPTVVQHLEADFLQEFDAVMLETRLGNNKVGAALIGSGELMPLVECWLYRNHEQIQLVVHRMVGSLKVELLKDAGIDRALRTASSRLTTLLRDYARAAPDKLDLVRSLGYSPDDRH